MSRIVNPKRYMDIDRMLDKIKQQLLDLNGYPYDLDKLEFSLGRIGHGIFDGDNLAIHSSGEKEFQVEVEYDRSVSSYLEILKGAKVQFGIDDRNFNWDQKGKAVLYVRLLQLFGRELTKEELLKNIDQLGFRPLILPELLSFAIFHPQEQLVRRIVGLGSRGKIYDGDQFVYLTHRKGKSSIRRRKVELNWLVNQWCFAVVKK